MAVTTPTFWKLLEESRLLTAEQVRQLVADFAQSGVAPNDADAAGLAQWLVSRNVLSKYQSKVFLAGQAGPFLYGEYSVYDAVEKGRLVGWFRAVHRPTGHPVLLQFLTGPVVADPRAWAHAAQLALAAGAIHSPHVQRYLEPVDLGTFKFLVSEDLRGASLHDRLAKGGSITPAEACRLVRLAAIGLAQLHACGRAHGDVRPANLWVESASGQQPANLKLLYEPQLLPPPLALSDADPAGRLAQIADFVAPELAQPGKAPDALTDIYALGCTLYSLLAGSPPFAGGTAQQKFLRHASEPIRPLEQFGVSQPLAQLVAFMMAKNPAVRFQSAAMVAEQLTPLVDPQAIHVPAAAPPATLAGYEAWVRQKHAQLAAAPRAAAPPAMPAPMSVPQPPVDLQIELPSAAKTSTKSTDQATAAYQKARKRRQITLVAGTVAAGIALLAGGFYVANWLRSKPAIGDGQEVASTDGAQESPGGDGQREITETSADTKIGDSKVDGAKSAATGGVEVVADDGKLLWASPTSGEPVSFRLLPPEGQVFVIARPAAMRASGEGAKVLTALGPAFAQQRTAWEKLAGIPLDQIERIIIGLHNNNGQFPRTSFVVRPKEPIGREDLLARWGQPAEQKEGAQTWYRGQDWSYYLPSDKEDQGAFLMASAADVQEVAKTGGAPLPLFRDVERLRRSSDGDRHVTVLFNPSFLFNDDGQPLFAQERAKVRPALAWFLGEGLAAVMISAHFDDRSYFEMRMLGSLDKERYTLASELRDRLKSIPGELENYMDRITPPSYWSKLARRYPLMVSALHANMRVGVEEDQAVVNSYLEGPAAHSLVLGGELLIASTPGAAVASSAAEPPAGPKTIEEVLNLKTSMSFASQSLEFAMRDIGDDVKANLLTGSSVEFDIKLMGKDMEKDGITRNQTITDFKQEDKTVAEVLTAMVMKANSPAVPDPAMPGQKLIWVVAPDPDQPDRQVILITTRTAAEREKYKLPPPFVPKG